MLFFAIPTGKFLSAKKSLTFWVLFVQEKSIAIEYTTAMLLNTISMCFFTKLF
jgi:hypothetical protein